MNLLGLISGRDFEGPWSRWEITSGTEAPRIEVRNKPRMVTAGLREKRHNDDRWMVVLSADKKGTPVTIGAGSVSKMIRCNDRGKWVTKTDQGKEVEVNNAFCYIVPKVEL
ncbi:hypothetical protein ANCCAN_02884 [Ancylostoma caninum]|uniref:Uncharacterized protein n=1 Tax=Ancylostoma caninum TaxID=29170 RepID=A0A368H735_ANCCA|nr:hypothetical protein ANCCAN_02884 [Ancylostoma caninum]